MDNDWMLHVLKDLRSFAELNGMDELADKLSEASDVARGAMACLEPIGATGSISYAKTLGSLDRSARYGQ